MNKTNLITNSLIDLGKEQEGNGKGRYFQSRFIEAGIAHYDELGDVLITKETLDKFIHTMVGCPVIINHKNITDKNVDKLRVGVISKVWFNELDGWFYCEGVLTDLQAIDLVKKQNWSVSCSYNFVSDNQKKTYHGKDIDMEFIDGEFLHLAIVENPRYEGANIVVNSKDNIKTDEKEKLVMSAMDDLKEFILSVVNNACKNEVEEEKAKEAENEEKEEEEKIENEEEEKKEEEKVKNKCKNEADEEETKNEDEEKEEKDIKEDKEVAENEDEEDEEDKKEVKNSMDDMKRIALGGSSSVKVQGLYTSQAERLELGNEY